MEQKITPEVGKVYKVSRYEKESYLVLWKGNSKDSPYVHCTHSDDIHTWVFYANSSYDRWQDDMWTWAEVDESWHADWLKACVEAKASLPIKQFETPPLYPIF